MPYALATDRPVFWAVQTGTNIIAAGSQPVNSITYTGEANTMLSDASELGFLAKTVGKAGNYKQLPTVGVWLQAGEIYQNPSDNGLVIVRQPHNRTIYPPEQTTNLFTVYREGGPDVLEWVAGEKVETGGRRTYGGKTWAAVTGHYTQDDYTPDKTPALWKEVREGGAAWDSKAVYAKDALVTHAGRTWKSLQDGNANREPGVVGTWRDTAVPPLWVAPAGTVGAWGVGDVVTYGGKTWRNTSANNAFAPGVWGWVEA